MAFTFLGALRAQTDFVPGSSFGSDRALQPTLPAGPPPRISNPGLNQPQGQADTSFGSNPTNQTGIPIETGNVAPGPSFGSDSDLQRQAVPQPEQGPVFPQRLRIQAQEFLENDTAAPAANPTPLENSALDPMGGSN